MQTHGQTDQPWIGELWTRYASEAGGGFNSLEGGLPNTNSYATRSQTRSDADQRVLVAALTNTATRTPIDSGF